jgi:hypothetical protein
VSALCIQLLVLLLSSWAFAAGAETYELENGDRITGEVIRQSDTEIVLEHPVLGRIEIPLAELAPKEGPRPGLLGTPLLAGWKRTLALGLNGQRGNTETTDIVAALDLDFEDEQVRWKVDARYGFSRAEGATTKHNGLVELNRDGLLATSPWFWFAGGRYDWDQFRSWDQRLSANSGIGRELVKTERFALRGRLGPAVTREFDGDDPWRYEAMFGVEATWAIDENHSIEVSNRFFQAVNDGQPYRNLTDARWRWQLSRDPALSLNVGIENEYVSNPAPGLDGNDLKYLTTLGIDF